MTIAVEEWDRMFYNMMPVVSTGIGALSVAIALIASRGVLAQRVYSEDGQYLVNVRYGQWHDLRDFIQPENPAVMLAYSEVGPDAWQLFDFVCREISYRHDSGEFWQLPDETLARGHGDCEDTSILLTSLLRQFTDASVILGNYGGYGHAWSQVNGQILETTYTRAQPVPNPQDYCPYVSFNDHQVVEFWPGALYDMFSLRRSEHSKFNLLAEALEVS